MKYTKIFAIVGAALLPIVAWADEGKAVSAYEKILIENSKKLNRNLPVMVDSETSLEATLVMGMQFHYKYKLVKAAAKDIDAVAFRKNMEENMIKTSRADKGAVILLKAGVEYVCSYVDKDGVLVASIRVNKKTCGIE